MGNYNSLSIYKILLSYDFGVWVWENENDLLFFNKAYMDMLGYPHNQFPFHISTWIELLHPEDKEKIIVNQQHILETPNLKDVFEIKCRMCTASGAYMWVLMQCFVLCRDEQGKALRVCGTHIDLNIVDQTLENMDLEHDRMLFALEAARDGLWDWNPQTDEVYFSPRYISMLGFQPQEFPPKLKSWLDRVHPDDLTKTIETQREYIKSPARGDIFECVYRFLDANGTYRWILGRGKVTKRDKNGQGIRVVGLHTDVTELRNAQENLVKLLHQDNLTQLYSRFYFDSILSNIGEKDYPISIIFCDLDGLKMVNDLLGHSDGDQMLINAASILRQATPPNGIAARLGGDEFAIMLCNTTETETENTVKRIQEKMEKYNEMPEVLPTFMSIGIAISQYRTSIYKLLSRADEAMLNNKKIQGKSKRHILISRIEKIIGQKITFLDNRLSEQK